MENAIQPRKVSCRREAIVDRLSFILFTMERCVALENSKGEND